MKFSDSIVFKVLFYCLTQVRVFDIRSKKELKKNLIRGKIFFFKNVRLTRTEVSPIIIYTWRFCGRTKNYSFNNQLSGDFVVAEKNNRLYGENNPLKTFIFMTIMLEL